LDRKRKKSDLFLLTFFVNIDSTKRIVGKRVDFSKCLVVTGFFRNDCWPLTSVFYNSCFRSQFLRQRLLDLDQFYNYNSYLNSTSFLGNDRAGSCQFHLQLTLEI
jgi:hypothetical protein